MIRPINAPHSADVRLFYESECGRLRLAQTGSSFVIFRDRVDLPPGRGAIIVSVDGQEYRREVYLDAGAKSDERETSVRPVDQIPF